MNADTPAVRSAATRMNGQKDKLMTDIREVVADAENLLKQARNAGAEGYVSVRAELEDKLAGAVLRLQEVREELKFRTRIAARTADAYVHENPWKSMGILAAAGIAIGLMLSRR